MPAMDYQVSSVPFAAIGRSILSIRRDQVHSVDGHGGGDSGSGGGRGQHHELELEAFQRRVADLFADLAASDAAADVLSLSWVRRLLDSFIICHEEFRSVLFGCGGGVRTRRPALARPPVERLVSEFFDRAVKALDVCNAIRDGVDQLRRWIHHLEIVIVSIGAGRRGPLGEGHVRRARKALTDLTILMLDEKETGAGTVVNHRNRSFGRSSKDPHHRRTGSGGGGASHFRSLSWSVSRSWSAARQLQAMETNLSAPRGNELTATNGLAAPLYTMSSVLLFVMWALVAAIPCQDRGLQTHFSVPRTFQWAAPITSLHERILEESKKKDRKNSCGLLKEIHAIEKCSRQLAELLDPIELPLPEEKEAELKQAVEELTAVYDALKEGLEPLERQVREMFHRMVRSRTEGLDCLSKAHNPE